MLPSPQKTLSIFVPSSLKEVPSGWILGCWHGTSNVIVYVTAVVHRSDVGSWHRGTSDGSHSRTFSWLGVFENETSGFSVRSRNSKSNSERAFPGCLRLRVDRGRLTVSDVKFQQECLVPRKQCKLFVYEPAAFLVSELLMTTTNTDTTSDADTFEKDLNCVELLLAVLRSWQQCRGSSDASVSDLVKRRVAGLPGDFHAGDRDPPLTGRYSNCSKRLWKFLFCSSFICQFTQRFHQIRHMSKIGKSGINVHGCLRCRNTLTSIVLDVLLGIFILYHFFQYMTVEQLLDLFITSANMVADNLQQLLHWLMGVPAGLKLNYQLNSALGYFFLYHIYLWKTYITVVRPILHIIITAITLLGWLGFSFQLSLVSDLMSLATFHVYCFYVYAARLYNLHMSGLVSLWRLVRGRKWNPLRHRVDSCAYSTDQLYLGTLIFMILLFLMPTTMLYYIVFCTLRLGGLAVVGLLHRTVSFINTAPVYTLLMYLKNSPLIRGEIRLESPVQLELHQPLCFKLTVVPSKCGKVCQLTKPMDFLPKDPTSWSTLVNSLIMGKLIYPF